jgi:hypothetical protein
LLFRPNGVDLISIAAAPNLCHNNFFKIVEHKNNLKYPYDKIHSIHKFVLLLLSHLCRSAIPIIIVEVTKSIISVQKLHIGKYVTIEEKQLCPVKTKEIQYLTSQNCGWKIPC